MEVDQCSVLDMLLNMLPVLRRCPDGAKLTYRWESSKDETQPLVGYAFCPLGAERPGGSLAALAVDSLPLGAPVRVCLYQTDLDSSSGMLPYADLQQLPISMV